MSAEPKPKANALLFRLPDDPRGRLEFKATDSELIGFWQLKGWILLVSVEVSQNNANG